MAETTIGANHKAYLARLQHLGEHFTAEKARLEAELRYVMSQAQRVDTEMVAVLRGYGIDAQQTPVQVDTDRGVIITLDIAPVPAQNAPPPAPEPEPEEQEG